MNSKVQARHLQRGALLYVRQSTLRQVVEHSEGTQRQYDLRQRGVALGWRPEQIHVIDSDLGQSGASAADREGFQRLVTEVGMARAGIVMGLEVSRLARNCTDWHRLLEICALTDTLILDEEGVYDPAHFNDRLLLGLKGTMSEAELHVLRARLRGGLLNQARRGALKLPLPIGLVYAADGQVQFDPDIRVRQSVEELFCAFRRTGSAAATSKAFQAQGLMFPRRSNRGEIVWAPLSHLRVLRVLNNPRYAGAYCFGRTRLQKQADGRRRIVRLPREEWLVLIHDAHEGYISWQEYEENQRRLRENASAYGVDRRGPPREGPALLQGLAICAACGDRMTVRYHVCRGRKLPEYVCQRRPPCQIISGKIIDDAVGKLLVDTVSPVALEVALAVQQQLEQRAVEVDRLRLQAVEQARYAAELARRRYMQVDPDNRLVADTLESDWNDKLRAVAAAQQDYEARRQSDEVALSEQKRMKIMQLATDFPRLWKSPTTPDRERKRMVRLLLEDVTLAKGDDTIDVYVRFKGGTSQTLHLPKPQPAWMLWQTPPELVAEIERLLDQYTEGQIARLLNERGWVSGQGRAFNTTTVRNIRLSRNLKSRYQRLREHGLIDKHAMAARLGISLDTLKLWRRLGRIRGYAYNDKGECLFPPPGDDVPAKRRFEHRKAGQSRDVLQSRLRSEERGAV